MCRLPWEFKTGCRGLVVLASILLGILAFHFHSVSLIRAGWLLPESCVGHSSAAVNCQHCGLCLICALQTHLTFGKEFTEAVEMKQVAQQEAERARFIVEKVPCPSEKLGNGSWYLLPTLAHSEHLTQLSRRLGRLSDAVT